MYTTYWIFLRRRCHRVGTWHVGWGLLILVTILLKLWTLCLVKIKTKNFWFVAWPHNWSVTWHCGWGSFILSHHPAKFGVHMLRENGNIMLSFVKWSKYRSVTWLCEWGPIILSHHPDKFGVHRPCESGDKTFLICHVTTISKFHVTFWVGPTYPRSPFC